MIIGVVLGRIFQISFQGEPDGWFYGIIVSFGTIFIRLLRMVIVPLILTSIISGVSSIGEGKQIGRLSIKTLLYYITTSIFAILIGLTLTNLIKPGVGADLPTGGTFDPSQIRKPGSLGDVIIRMIPLNPFKAATDGDMLGIIFFAVFVGVVITMLNAKSKKTLQEIFNAGFDLMMKITEFVIKLAPLGVMGLITKAVATSGFGVFNTMWKYMVTVAGGLTLHMLLVLPMIFFLLTRMNPILHFRAMAPALLTAFSTSSSNSTLPLTISCVEKNAGVSNRISSFVLPLGATVNMDGTALYECAGVIFISQILALKLSIIQQIIVVLTALLASIGAAGIPSAGLVVIFIVTQAIGFKDGDVAMIIATMLAVDRPLDMYRTMINVLSDSIGTVVIAKSEGEKNFYKEIKK